MNRPLMESMEPRLLLSAGVVAAGETAVFDMDGNGVNDAVLANLGAGDLEYEYTEGSTGFDVINVAADGAAFQTNTWVTSVGDTDAADDFDLTKVLLQKRTKYGCTWFDPVLGVSNIEAGAIDYLELGAAGSLGATTSEGDLLKVLLRDDATLDLSSAGNIEKICGFGDLSGSVQTAGDIGILTANDLSGFFLQAGGTLNKLVADRLTNSSNIKVDALGRLVINVIDGKSTVSVTNDADKIQACAMENMTIITGGDLNYLCAGTIIGSEVASSITVGGHMICLCANTITGGVNGTLEISIGAGLDKLSVNRLEGGNALGGSSSTSVSVIGELDVLWAGILSGGQADDYGYAQLNISTTNLTSGGEVLEYGNIGKLRAMGISGGDATNGGDGIFFLSVGNDLVDACVGRITGSGALSAGADPLVLITVGHDIVRFSAGQISAGAAGENAYAGVLISADNDILDFSAGRIDGGTADGNFAWSEVGIYATRDIRCLRVNSISGGGAITDNATSSLSIDAGRNIEHLCVGSILGGRADGNGALSSTTIRAANDIGMLCSGLISGGSSANGASAYTKIVAEHDIVKVCVGTILGSQNHIGGCDPAVQIQAYNDIKFFAAWQIVAGEDGVVNILAGIDAYGNISGDDGIAGSIEYMSVGVINGMGGVINIAAGGDIDYLKACCILSGDGEVNIVAEGDITASVCCVWGDGVEFAAGGEVNDLRGTIRDEFITEGEPVELPIPI